MTIEEIAKKVNAKWVHQIRCGDHRFIDISKHEASTLELIPENL